MNLGPLELKLLNVSGKHMPVYRPATPEKEIRKMKEVRPDEWPVTVAMLHRTLRQLPTPRTSDPDAAAAAAADPSSS